jgi:hypothetical protein
MSMWACKKQPLPDIGSRDREINGGTSKEDFLTRLSKIPTTQSNSMKENELKKQISSKYCIMLGHKQGYEVITDPKLIPMMGKKIL